MDYCTAGVVFAVSVVDERDWVLIVCWVYQKKWSYWRRTLVVDHEQRCTEDAYSVVSLGRVYS
jgi:hypothetical protein